MPDAGALLHLLCFSNADIHFIILSVITPRYLNFSDCCGVTPLTQSLDCLGCLNRHMVYVFFVLIFIPAAQKPIRKPVKSLLKTILSRV